MSLLEWEESHYGKKTSKTGSNVCPKPTEPLAVLKPLRVSVKQLAWEQEDTMCATVPSLWGLQHAAAIVHFHTNSLLTYSSYGAEEGIMEG